MEMLGALDAGRYWINIVDYVSIMSAVNSTLSQ